MTHAVPARSAVRRAFRLDASGLGRRIVSGASFKLGGTVARTVLTLGSTAVLARLLLPADYGYIAMATIVTELAGLFASAGITDTLVQRRRVTRIQFDTAFWALLGIGLGLGAIVAFISLWAGAIFGDPKVGPFVLALGFLFPINSLPAVSNVIMTRLMDFRAEFMVTTASLLLRSLAAIAAARFGMGSWSLVIGAYVGALATLVLTVSFFPFLPRWRFSRDYLRSTWRVSSTYLSGGLIYYVHLNVDLVLVSRYWGATSLGLYQNARALADELRARLAAPLAQTLFPAFSSVQDHAERMIDLFKRGSRVLAAVILLFGGVLSATSQEVVELLFGPRWLGMVPLIAMFGLSAGVRGATALASPLLNAGNRPGFALKHHLIGTVLVVLATVLALPHGIEAVAGALALCSLYALVPYSLAVKEFGFGFGAVLRIMLGPMAAALACVGGVLLLRRLCAPMELGLHLRLVLFGATGAAIYLAVLTLVAREHLHELAGLARRLLQRRGAAA